MKFNELLDNFLQKSIPALEGNNAAESRVATPPLGRAHSQLALESLFGSGVVECRQVSGEDNLRKFHGFMTFSMQLTVQSGN